MRLWIWFLDPDSAGFSIDFKTSEMLSSIPFRVFLCRRRMRLHCDKRACVTEIPVGVFLEGKRIRLTNAPPSSGEGGQAPAQLFQTIRRLGFPIKAVPRNFPSPLPPARLVFRFLRRTHPPYPDEVYLHSPIPLSCRRSCLLVDAGYYVHGYKLRDCLDL
jgi:hypothetical protein